MTPVPGSVLAYVESAWSRAMPVECGQGAVDSLIAFFRTGMLYYQPHATLPWTINPFRRLVKKLPEAEMDKITRFYSEFADRDPGIGAFNLNLVFERAAEGVSRETPVRGHRVELRRDAVETCYGYWVAEPLFEEVEAKLDRASAGKRRRLKAMCEWMETSRDAIVGAYSTYLGDVGRTLDDAGVDFRAYESKDLFKDTSAIERRVDFLLAVLRTDHRLAPHYKAFVPCEGPEIWEDETARTLFEESFFDSLACAWSAERRYGSAKLILESLAPSLERLDSSDNPAKAIRTALERALGMENWYEDNFG